MKYVRYGEYGVNKGWVFLVRVGRLFRIIPMYLSFAKRAAMLVVGASVFSGTAALADSINVPFTYSIAEATVQDGGATVMFSGNSGSGSYASYGDDISLQAVTIVDASAPGNLGDLVIPFDVTFNQDGFSQTVTDTATLNFTRLDSGGEISTLTSLVTPSIALGGTLFKFGPASYAGPTINSTLSPGHISLFFQTSENPNSGPSTATPLPESAVAGFALFGALGIAKLKRRPAGV